MPEKPPEEAAARIGEKLRATQVAAGEATTEGALGRQVLRVLEAADSASRADLLQHFSLVVADPATGTAERAQAEKLIGLLRSDKPA